MSHENYKKTLTNSQKIIFEKLEKELTDYIKEKENKIAALELLAYCPKKDGTPKSNFSLNFGLVAPWGESFRVKRWENNPVENERYVKVSIDYNFSGKPSGIDFRFRPHFNDRFNTDPKEENKFEYFEDRIYFGWDGFTKWAGFDPCAEPEKLTAEFAYRAMKEFHAGNLKASIERQKKELEELPKWFDKAKEMAVKMRELVESCEGLTTVHSFIYRHFEHGEIYYLNH